MQDQINQGSEVLNNAAAVLIGDPSKAQRELGWSAKTHWEDLAKLMVDADLELGKR